MSFSEYRQHIDFRFVLSSLSVNFLVNLLPSA